MAWNRRLCSAESRAVLIALQLLFIACFATPIIVAALSEPRIGVAGAWYTAVLLVVALGLYADPVAFGLLRVDDSIFGGYCGFQTRAASTR